MVNSNYILKVSGISKSYSATKGIPQRIILKDVSFELKTNEISFLCGSNGSGKSTLLKIISNEIESDNPPVFEFSKDSNWKKNHKDHLIYLPQIIDYALADTLKISEYISLFDKKEVELMLKELQLEWLESNIKSKKILISQLSFGQKQLLLAIALLTYSKSIFLFDEVFASIDTLNRNLIMTLIQNKLKRTNATVLIVSHDLNFIHANADNIYFIANGDLKKYKPEDITSADFQSLFE